MQNWMTEAIFKDLMRSFVPKDEIFYMQLLTCLWGNLVFRSNVCHSRYLPSFYWLFLVLSRSVVSDSLWLPGLQPVRLLCPWGFFRPEYGVGSLSLLQGIFPTQGSNPGLPHCRWILYQLSHLQGLFFFFSRFSVLIVPIWSTNCLPGLGQSPPIVFLFFLFF